MMLLTRGRARGGLERVSAGEGSFAPRVRCERRGSRENDITERGHLQKPRARATVCGTHAKGHKQLFQRNIILSCFPSIYVLHPPASRAVIITSALGMPASIKFRTSGEYLWEELGCIRLPLLIILPVAVAFVIFVFR